MPPEALLALMGKVEADGLELLGQGGVLAELTKVVIERALEEERTLGQAPFDGRLDRGPVAADGAGPVLLVQMGRTGPQHHCAGKDTLVGGTQLRHSPRATQAAVRHGRNAQPLISS